MGVPEPTYDVAIIGGGLAGLALSIQLASLGHSVVVIEKEKYPFHKVCGEYVSLESWNFLMDLGLSLNELDLPIIDTLLLTAPSGRSFSTRLPLGGFGISRHVLDYALAELAIQKGVHLLQQTKADEVTFSGNSFKIKVFSKSNSLHSTIRARVCCAAHGKRSNLDIKWRRGFLQGRDKKLDNYIAVKYHLHTEWKENVIGLHNFNNGYCGISKIEEGKYCLCYMTKAEELRACNNDIRQLEEKVLYQNPFLKSLLSKADRIEPFPVTISQISFNKKTQVENRILMLGDAAGMITPLCGNGMSIALHTSKIAAPLINGFLLHNTSRERMEALYCKHWLAQFSTRLAMGRLLQRFFGKESTTELFVRIFRMMPFLARPVVKLTHGQPF